MKLRSFWAAIVMLLVALPAYGASYNEAMRIDANGNVMPPATGSLLKFPNGATITNGAYNGGTSTSGTFNGPSLNSIAKLGFSNAFAASIGLPLEVYFAPRTDGASGTGTKLDPYNSTNFESTAATLPNATHIFLAKGTYSVTRHDTVTTNLKPGWILEGEGRDTIIQMNSSLTGVHFMVSPLTCGYNVDCSNLTVRNLTIDANWPNLASTADDGTGGAIAPTDGVTTSGSATVSSAATNFDPSFMYRTISGTGIPASTRVARIPTTTLAAASDGATLPQATINVASTADFASAGTIWVSDSIGFDAISYTGKTSTTFTGCSGGTGVISTGRMVSTLHQLVLTSNATATGTGITFTIGGQKRASLGGIGASGSNITYENVRIINTYGSFQNSLGAYGAEAYESFPAGIGSPTGGSAVRNNHIRKCLFENFYGDYNNAGILVGLNSRLPASDSSIEDCYLRGQEWPLAFGAMHSFGGAWVKNCRFSRNDIRFGGTFYYIDTGSQESCLIDHNKARDMWGGIYLLTISDPTWTTKDLRFVGNQVEMRNYESGGDVANAIRVATNTPDALYFENNKFTQREGAFGSYFGSHVILLQNATNAKFYWNTFETLNGFIYAVYGFTGSTGTQAFGNRDQAGSALSGLGDNIPIAATTVTASSAMHGGSVASDSTVSGDGHLLTNVDARNVAMPTRAVNDVNTTISSNDYLIVYTNTTATRTVTIGSASSFTGLTFVIKDEGGTATGANKIIFSASVEGSTDAVATAYGKVTIYSRGGTWHRL